MLIAACIYFLVCLLHRAQYMRQNYFALPHYAPICRERSEYPEQSILWAPQKRMFVWPLVSRWWEYQCRETLVQTSRSSENSKVMIQPPCRWYLVRSFGVPVPGDASPDFSVVNVRVLNGHTVSSLIPQTVYPGVLAC